MQSRHEVVKERPVTPSQGVLADQTIRLIGTKAGACPYPLRRITYRDSATEKVYGFLTNHFRFAARTVAQVYKEHWQIFSGSSSKT